MCFVSFNVYFNAREIGRFFVVLLARLQGFLYLCRQIRESMRTRSEYIDTIRAHRSELQKRFGITSMRMFGSVARNEHHDGSDVDLFVTMPPKFYNHIAAAQYLEQLLGCGVDLIQEHRGMRPFFKQQIEDDGIDVFSPVAGN